MAAGSRMRTHQQLHDLEPAQQVSAAEARLRQRGQRVTAQRRWVLQVLAGSGGHLTAEQVAAALAGKGVHRATVYRSLEALAAADVLTTRQLVGGATAYHLAAVPADHDHLHAYCGRCGSVVVLPPNVLDAASAAILETTGFNLDPLRASLQGVCAGCTTSAAPVTSAPTAP